MGEMTGALDGRERGAGQGIGPGARVSDRNHAVGAAPDEIDGHPDAVNPARQFRAREARLPGDARQAEGVLQPQVDG